MSRVQVDVDDLLGQVFGVTHVSPTSPAKIAGLLPWTVAFKIGGDSPHVRLLDAPTVQVDSYASTRRAASDLAAANELALWDAWRNQTHYPAGHVHRLEVTSSASETTSGLDEVWKFTGTYSLQVRPN